MATQEAAIGTQRDVGARVEQFETVVIGGGQAGLSVGYYLKKQGGSFVILDANERIGGSWRTRTWDSLRLFTPARYDGLPGWPFPAPGWSYPTKDEVGDYMEDYAKRVPALSPRVADSRVGVQDHERPISLRQVVAHGEARLAASDDHGLEALVATRTRHSFPLPPDLVGC